MSSQQIIKIGTRGSQLALWQAHYTQRALAEQGATSELVIIKTKGDAIQHLSLDKIEGKGFFTKEIEDALADGRIDLAVHSMKDLPTTPSDPRLVITALSYRADPADWLIVNKPAQDSSQLFTLPQQAIVGTSSSRRKAQLLDFRPDVRIQDIRGNVPTRLRKLQSGAFDGILLAAAGLTRLDLDLSAFHVVKFNPREFIPAPAQGVLAWQTRKDDRPVRTLLKKIHHTDVAAVTNVERKVLSLFDGGCHLPLGVYCTQDDHGYYHVSAAYAESWDSGTVKKVSISSSTHFELAEQVVAALGE